MLYKKRWVAGVCVLGMLCGVLCSCTGTPSSESKLNSAPPSLTSVTTTSATTMMRTTTTITTTKATTSSSGHTTSRTDATSTNSKQFYYHFMGERVLMTFEKTVLTDDFYPVKQSENDWVIVNEGESFCVAENMGADDELLLHRYSGKLSNGDTLRCSVNPKTQKIFMIVLSMPSNYQYGENDKAAIETHAKKWMDAMGYQYRADDIHVLVQADKAKNRGYFAYVFIHNKIDGGVCLYVRKSTQGWRIVNMHLSVDNTMNSPEWVA